MAVQCGPSRAILGHEGEIADGVCLGREWARVLAPCCHLGPIRWRSPVALDPGLALIVVELTATLLLQALSVLALEWTRHESAPGRIGGRGRDMVHLAAVLVGVLEIVDARNLRVARNLNSVHGVLYLLHRQPPRSIFGRPLRRVKSTQYTPSVPVFYQG